jgi:hypothetical protein
MRKDKGLNGDLDRLPLLTWLMFLKFLDDHEAAAETNAALARKKYRPTIDPPYRWRDWAAKDALTGDELLKFVSSEETVRPDASTGPGLVPYLRSFAGSADPKRRVVGEVFSGVTNRMESGYLLRSIVEQVNGIHFNSSDEIHTLGHLYESMLKEMRDAAGDSGEFYTPRAVVKFMVQATDPRLGETVLDPAAGTGGFVPEQFDGWFTSNEYPTFDRDTQRLVPAYLADFFRWPEAWRGAAALSTGMGDRRQRIQPEQLLKHRIPLLPLAEQRRIVARVEAVAARSAEARRLREESTAEADALLGASLGRFFASMAERYSTQNLGELSVYITDGPHLTPTYVPEGVPFVTVKNMVTGRLTFDDLQYITPADRAEFIKRCHPERGDVLYSKDGATRGRPCLVDTDREFSIFASVALIKPKRDQLDGAYLCYVLRSNWIRDRMQSKSRGDMIPHIVLREIRAFPIPLPRLAEQRRIVAHLSAPGEGGRAAGLQAETAAELDTLLPAVLAKAFAGEL